MYILWGGWLQRIVLLWKSKKMKRKRLTEEDLMFIDAEKRRGRFKIIACPLARNDWIVDSYKDLKSLAVGGVGYYHDLRRKGLVRALRLMAVEYSEDFSRSKVLGKISLGEE